jgi:signal transduction histidine kinase
VNIASHDLRAPLGTLGLVCEAALILLNKEATVPVEAMRAKLDTMRRQVRRMKRLIDHLLDVARTDERQPTLQLEPMDLVEVVRDACEQCREDLEAARCRLSADFSGEILGRWDRRQLAQVISNLLTNAGKYGRGKPIRVAAGFTAETAWIEVSDEGAGIAPEDQQRIFGRFERLASARHAAGLGLGLWISKRIVDAMGGKIDVSSDVGRGATFTVILPRNVEGTPPAELA